LRGIHGSAVSFERKDAITEVGVLVEEGGDGALEVAHKLRRDGAAHRLAAVEGVLLGDGAV